MAIYRNTFRGTLETGEEWNTTWHCSGVTGQAAVVNAAAVDAFTLMWNGSNTPAGNITGDIANEVTVDDVVTDELNDADRNVDQIVGTLGLAGTSSDASLPPHVAVAVSLRTLSPTKKGRGRFYLPPLVVTTVSAGLLASTPQTHCKNGALAALNHMASSSFPVVVFHRNTGGSFDLVTSVDVGNVFDVQSRRRNQIAEIRVRSNLS